MDNNYQVYIKVCQDDIDEIIETLFQKIIWTIIPSKITKKKIDNFINVLENKIGTMELLTRNRIRNGDINLSVTNDIVRYSISTEYGEIDVSIITNDALIAAFKSIAIYFK
jgi:hypothetical protein